jgi:hypothetical protein
MTTIVEALKESLRRRYRALLKSGEIVTAGTMATNIRTPEGLTDAEVLALAEEVIQDMYAADLQRLHLRAGRREETP